MSKHEAVQFLKDNGYDAYINTNNVVMVVGEPFNKAFKKELQEALIIGGYNQSWGISPIKQDVKVEKEYTEEDE